MPLKFFNTLGRKKQVFKPLSDKKVGLYCCGPTVYGPIHIGNARTFIAFDILYRYLKYKGFKVKYVQNITDVGHLSDIGEDKIMKGAALSGMNPFDFVQLMIKKYFDDLKSLNILKPDISPRASEHIGDIIEIIKILIKKGYAYVSEGYVYYDISKFRDYGKLSGQNPEDLKKQRTEPHPNKKNDGDFALWIPAPGNYPMKWDSPWGKGFPGWHIECSTMSSKYLGLPFDIHGGGKDLIFPHHEDEIAQAEAATGKKFVNYWAHSEFVLIDSKKMSKSLGNIISARDAVQKYGAKAIRYLLLSSHYRTEINITEEVIESAKETVDHLIDFVDRLQELKPKEKYNEELKEKIKIAKEKFTEYMDDDLNIGAALTAVQDLVRETNKAIEERKISKKNLKEVFDTMMEFDEVLGILAHEKEKAPKEIQTLLREREAARAKKDFIRADEIRKKINELGWIVEDSPTGPRVKKND